MSVTGVMKILDEFPNLYVDASAVVDEIGRHPKTARKLFMKYPDRIIHGTDILILSAWESPAWLDQRQGLGGASGPYMGRVIWAQAIHGVVGIVRRAPLQRVIARARPKTGARSFGRPAR